MIRYKYNQYNVKTTYSSVYVSSTVSTSTQHYSMFASSRIDENTGVYILSGTATVTPGSYAIGMTTIGSNLVTRQYNGSADQLTTLTWRAQPKYARGTFVQSVYVEKGSLPANGKHVNNWYVYEGLYESATITSPSAGSALDGLHLITWTKTHADLNVDVELMTDGAWEKIASNYDGLNYEYDFSLEADNNSSYLRIRMINGSDTSSWNTSSRFSIRHFPVFYTKSGLLLKEIKDGGVKVGGSYRKIKRILVKQNGQLKEV